MKPKRVCACWQTRVEVEHSYKPRGFSPGVIDSINYRAIPGLPCKSGKPKAHCILIVEKCSFRISGEGHVSLRQTALLGPFFRGRPGRRSLFCRSWSFGSFGEQGSSGKADPFASRNVNRGSATDGFDGACRDGGQLPRTKPDEAHLVAFGNFFAHRLGQRVKHGIRLFQRHLGLGGNQMGQFLFANDLCGLGISAGHDLLDPFCAYRREGWRAAPLLFCRDIRTAHRSLPARSFHLPSCPGGQP